MIQFFYYDRRGRILMTGGCLESNLSVQMPPEGCSLGVGAPRLQEDYIELVTSPGIAGHTPLIQDRPEMTPQVNGSVISGLPQPCHVTVAHATYEVTDGTVELEFDLPGTYPVRIEAFPYRPAEIEVTA